MKDKIEQVYEFFIRTTPEKLWRAIVEGEFTKRYFFGTEVKTTARKGEPIEYIFEDGKVGVDGVVLEADPPRRLVHTWVVHYDERFAGEKSKVTWEIEKRGEVTKLTVRHDLTDAPKVAREVGFDGWSIVLSSLKTLLETGEPLAVEMPRAA